MDALGQRCERLPLAARLFETHQCVELVATADRCLQMVMKDPNAGPGVDAEAEVREPGANVLLRLWYATVTPPSRPPIALELLKRDVERAP